MLCIFQFARPERCRGAVQPRGDSCEGTAGGQRATQRAARLSGARLGAGHGRTEARGHPAGRQQNHARHAVGRETVCARAPARDRARATAQRSGCHGGAGRLAQSSSLYPRGLLHRAGAHGAGRARDDHRGGLMSAVIVIARGVFKESIRDRIPYNLVFFAVLLMAASFLLAQLTAGQDVKIIKDLGLASASAIGVLIAIFIGIGLVAKEVERRSIYSLLSKPVTRPQFILGKYAGLVLTLVANLVVMAAAFYVVLAYLAWVTPSNIESAWEAPATDPRMLKAFVLIAVELMLITAVALFFSTFSSPFLSAALTGAVSLIGHFSADLKNSESVVEAPALATLARAVYYVTPNLSPLDVRTAGLNAQPV